MASYIRNVVLAGPEGSWHDDHWEGPAREHAMFYAELLEMRIIREDWIVVAKDADTFPRLAFGDGPTEEYRPPRWPDPNRPQQIHLDIAVPDVNGAAEAAAALGATLLQDNGEWRSYADPAGHPFCLWPGDADSPRISRIVFDCFSPRALAGFYSELLELPKRREDSPEFVVIDGDRPGMPALAFQHAPHTVAPRWPDPRYPQQVHLDLHFDDASTAQERAERLGAIRLPNMGGSCPVYADPAAHPFCLCSHGQ